MLNQQTGRRRLGRGGELEVHKLGVVAQGAVGGCCWGIYKAVWGLTARDRCRSLGYRIWLVRSDQWASVILIYLEYDLRELT